MKYIVVVTALFLCSCATSPEYTGQQFVEESPTFYMSIAPSFDTPYEYEVKDGILELREYSGLGGYIWGKRTLVAASAINRQQQDNIRSLTLEAIADTIDIESKRREVGEIVVVTDGITWYIQSDLAPFLSISTNNPESKAFDELLDLLNSIVKSVPDGGE